ncbi:MFS transporter [Mycobacterium sp. CBMA293]|uniref:MFS transporter n=1 Tax=unclassified Mycolicibacterium TaxID=2636767 RepID=UPI0012DF70E8|nr:MULTISPECIES: MFS transporter [unclassified Mycolicibacterium]MUL49882.1 MFS transporter [Mycolicibacterium sp. CBMA 360]MUL62701.1 MFS transporter [Mycolicibacterium sp. CBMA 335]MUL70751.1 MFS transporter [Mycolicibacterium sp. CBMA 311]MUL97225.1 MFS transporter [Mycolicibacterium sp. CBMA 230]MUM15182.1 MFS transporter [Mycolicibacterium sp. CBMA 293]
MRTKSIARRVLMSLRQHGSRGFLSLLGFAFVVEGALYSAVTPILPLLSRRFSMSDTRAGLMLSSYSAGIVVGALLCVVTLRYVNARGVAVGALAVLGVSTVVFAWAHTFEAAFAARLIQGIAGGATWTACTAWLLRLWPIDKRGEALGLAMGPAIVGAVAGPAIGTIAIDLGIGGPYTAVAALCLGAACWLLRMPPPTALGGTVQTKHGTVASRRALALLGVAMTVITGALVGLINLAGPAVLVSVSSVERAGGVVFVIAALTTVIAARPLGVLVDRWGATRTASLGMLITAIGLPVFGVGLGTYLTGALVVLIVVATNICYISSGALLTGEGERLGWSLHFLTALTATVWGIGETAGGVVAGIGLDRIGTEWTSAAGGLLAAAMLGGIIVVSRCVVAANTNVLSPEVSCPAEEDCAEQLD